MDDLYPVKKEESKQIESFIDPETGEILDMEAFNKAMMAGNYPDDLKKTLVNKIKLCAASQDMIKNEIMNMQKLLKIQANREASVMRFLKVIIDVDGPFDFTVCGAKLRKNPPKIVINDET